MPSTQQATSTQIWRDAASAESCEMTCHFPHFWYLEKLVRRPRSTRHRAEVTTNNGSHFWTYLGCPTAKSVNTKNVIACCAHIFGIYEFHELTPHQQVERLPENFHEGVTPDRFSSVSCSLIHFSAGAELLNGAQCFLWKQVRLLRQGRTRPLLSNHQTTVARIWHLRTIRFT